VAAHLEPEVLLVDEVLAVGGVEFQKKCLGKMGEVARGGRTILFVSHNLDAISRLCSLALLLDGGKRKFFGPAEEAVRCYLQAAEGAAAGYADLREARGWHAHRRPQILWVSTHDRQGNRTSDFVTGGTLGVRLGYQVEEPIRAGYCQINVFDRFGSRVTSVTNTHGQPPLELGRSGVLECRMEDIRLANGQYHLDLSLGPALPERQCLDYVPSAIGVRVSIGDYLGGARLAPGQGVMGQRSRWKRLSAEERPTE